MTINTHSINSLKKEELQRHIISLGEEKFRAKQLWKWLYVKGAKSFSEMTDIGKNLRLKLSDNNSIQRLKTSQHQVSVDGTQKWVFELFECFIENPCVFYNNISLSIYIAIYVYSNIIAI